ncbi:hypothetical protein ACFLWK_00235 [Chloroflexota bacterium]
MLRQSEIREGVQDRPVPDDIRELAYRIVSDVMALAARVSNSNSFRIIDKLLLTHLHSFIYENTRQVRRV